MEKRVLLVEEESGWVILDAASDDYLEEGIKS